MTFTLTTDELKVASCGSLDFSKFTDSTKGYLNIADNNYKYFAFIAQDVLDAGFTEEQGKTIIDSLTAKKVIIDESILVTDIANLNKEDYDSWVQDCFLKQTGIDCKWMFFLSREFINDRASS